MTTTPLANLLGFIGASVILAGFAWQTLRAAPPDVVSTAANLAGACLLAASLSIDVNLPSLLLEIAWAALSLIGLARLLRARA